MRMYHQRTIILLLLKILLFLQVSLSWSNISSSALLIQKLPDGIHKNSNNPNRQFTASSSDMKMPADKTNHIYLSDDDNDLVLDDHIRRCILKYSTVIVTAAAAAAANTRPAFARNLPANTGADLSKTGTVQTLVSIVELRNVILKIQSLLLASDKISSNTMEQIEELLDSLNVNDETSFKKLFDSYSDPVSYKQKYLDQNAFLVYYTNGFDGFGRPSIEEESSVPKQTIQYGLRNESWSAFDDFTAEYLYAKKSSFVDDDARDSMLVPINKCLESINSYLDKAPKQDLDSAINDLLH